MYILLIIVIYIIGMVIGYILRLIALRLKSYDGIIVVINEDDRLVYSLELHRNPEDLESMKEVIFKVETSGRSS